MTKRILFLVCTICAVIGLAGAALAVSTSGRHRHRAAPKHHRKPPVHRVDRSITSQLGIFRHARVASTSPVISEGTREAFAHISSYAGANLALARAAGTPNDPVYLIPGDRQICFISAGGMACGTSSRLASSPASYALFSGSIENPRGTLRVSGIASDDVQRIAAVRKGDDPVSIPVANNGYSSLIPADSTSLEFTTRSNGTIIAPVPNHPK